MLIPSHLNICCLWRHQFFCLGHHCSNLGPTGSSTGTSTALPHWASYISFTHRCTTFCLGDAPNTRAGGRAAAVPATALNCGSWNTLFLVHSARSLELQSACLTFDFGVVQMWIMWIMFALAFFSWLCFWKIEVPKLWFLEWGAAACSGKMLPNLQEEIEPPKVDERHLQVPVLLWLAGSPSHMASGWVPKCRISHGQPETWLPSLNHCWVLVEIPGCLVMQESSKNLTPAKPKNVAFHLGCWTGLHFGCIHKFELARKMGSDRGKLLHTWLPLKTHGFSE